MIYKLYFNITVQKKMSPRQSLFSRHVLVVSTLARRFLAFPFCFEASLLLSCLESLSLSLKKKNWTQLLIWLSALLTCLILASLQSWVRNPSSCSSSLPLPQCQRQPSAWSCINRWGIQRERLATHLLSGQRNQEYCVFQSNFPTHSCTCFS